MLPSLENLRLANVNWGHPDVDRLDNRTQSHPEVYQTAGLTTLELLTHLVFHCTHPETYFKPFKAPNLESLGAVRARLRRKRRDRQALTLTSTTVTPVTFSSD